MPRHKENVQMGMKTYVARWCWLSQSFLPFWQDEHDA